MLEFLWCEGKVAEKFSFTRCTMKENKTSKNVTRIDEDEQDTGGLSYISELILHRL